MTKALLLIAAALAAAPAAAYDFIEFQEPVPVDFVQGGSALAGAGDRVYWLDDRRGLLHVLTLDGRVVRASEPGALDWPQGLALAPNGELYVADTGNSRVVVYDRDGKQLRVIGEKGSAPGQLYKPRSVAVGLDGRVWVSDSGNNRVSAYTQEGVFLFAFGRSGKEGGQFKDPGRIAVDAGDDVFVLDEGNERVQKFDAGTKHVKDFQLHGTDFALDEYGFLYMLDPKRGKVMEVGPDGVVLGSFGTEGKGKGQLRKAAAIAVDDRGLILVADSGNKRLQRVRLENKLKVRRVAMNVETKLLVTGPARVLPVAGSALAVSDDQLFVWLPKTRQVAVFKGKKELKRFGGAEVKGEAAIRGAKGLAASPKLGLFIADGSGDKIMSFGLGGEHRINFGAAQGFFASKKKEGVVRSPAGVALNEKGTVYVADAGNRRVDGFQPDGNPLFTFGPVVGPYELKNPVSVAYDEAGFVYVLDEDLKRILKCEPSGGYVKAFGEEGDGVAQFEDPVSLAYDGRSYLYVLDRGKKRVMIFDREGRWVTNFFAGGEGERSLNDPAALAVAGSELLVADPGRGRVSGFQLKPRLAPPVAVSTKAADGEVILSWDASADPWASQYHVWRATQPAGPWEEEQAGAKPGYKDSEVEAYKSYWYRVAVEAGTGDVGPFSRPVEVLVPGSFNVAPVEIATAAVGNIFSANYKWYLKNPLGKAVVQNNLNVPFQNVKVSFRLKEFMDFATESTLDRLAPKEKAEVLLSATLNNRILDVSEDTPVQAEITLTYFEKGQKRENSLALPLRVYSRRAITWEDPRRIANFMTPNDPPVDQLKSAVLRDPPKGPEGVGRLPADVVSAARLWAALSAGGVRFLTPPNNPFEKASVDPTFPVDYTQFARDTLDHKSGDCDELVTLYASLLENAAVRTALLDYPGHMAMMFDTGARDVMEAGLPEDLLVSYAGTMWVPIETTMLGEPFEDAVRKAAFAYKEMSAKGKASVIDPRKAWLVYEPATLPKPEGAPFAFDADAARKRFEATAQELLAARYKTLSAELDAKLKADGESTALWDQKGVLEAESGRLDEAEKDFKRALALDAGDAAALNNLGNLDYQAGRVAEAQSRYQKAAEEDPADGGILMNLARAALKLGKAADAKGYADKAVALDEGLKEEAALLLKP